MTSDGQAKEETGEIVNKGTENEALEVHGSYSYIGDDGQEYIVEYTAGVDGFQPTGEHLVESAGVSTKEPPVGLPSAALASLAGK